MIFCCFSRSIERAIRWSGRSRECLLVHRIVVSCSFASVQVFQVKFSAGWAGAHGCQVSTASGSPQGLSAAHLRPESLCILCRCSHNRANCICVRPVAVSATNYTKHSCSLKNSLKHYSMFLIELLTIYQNLGEC